MQRLEKFTEKFLPFDKDLLVVRPNNMSQEDFKTIRKSQTDRLKARVKYGFMLYVATEIIEFKTTGTQTKRNYPPYKRASGRLN